MLPLWRAQAAIGPQSPSAIYFLPPDFELAPSGAPQFTHRNAK